MMNYFKKSITSTYKKSKDAVLKATKASHPYVSQTLLSELRSSKKQILSTRKMSKLADLSYNIEEFEAIIITLFQVLTTNDEFNLTYLYEASTLKKKMRRVRNYLVVCGYLIKHGASGFIDQFRERMQVFEHYSDEKMLACNYQIATQLRQRAQYITILHTDKRKLLKQKQLSMLIKQKMQLSQQEDITDHSHPYPEHQLPNKHPLSEQSPTSKTQKLQNFLQNYLFRYITKLDEGLDQVAEFLANQADKYLLEEMPENFEIDEADGEEYNPRSEVNLDRLQKEEEQFVRKKNIQRVVEKDLLGLGNQ